jgi:hypothetical protein
MNPGMEEAKERHVTARDPEGALREKQPRRVGGTEAPPPHPFRAALEGRDLAAAVEALAPDVVMRSPVIARPIEGRDEVSDLLRILLTQELEAIECLDEVRSGDRLALRFQVRVRGRDIEVVDFVRLDENEKVREYIGRSPPGGSRCLHPGARPPRRPPKRQARFGARPTGSGTVARSPGTRGSARVVDSRKALRAGVAARLGVPVAPGCMPPDRLTASIRPSDAV